MNSSKFMDKQIMDLTASQNNPNSNNVIFDLLNPSPQEEEQQQQQNTTTSSSSSVGGAKKDLKEEILPSYDFQPIRPTTTSSSVNLDNNCDGVRVWNSADSKTNSSVRVYGSVDANESAKVTQEKDRKSYDAAVMSEIDRAVKKHADDLLHAIEGVSARISQMESRTRNLENSVDDLKASIENNNGSTEGKLRHLDNVLREVQSGVQFLRDKHEIAEAHLQLAKLQASKVDKQPETQNSTTHSDTLQQPAFASQQSPQHPVVPQQPFPVLSPPNAPPPPPHQNTYQVQLPQATPNQIPSIPQRESYFPPPGQLLEATQQPYQLPSAQPSQPAAPHQRFQPVPPQLPSHYSQASQLPQHHQPVGPMNPSLPHHQSSASHHSEENHYAPPPSYPPSIRQSPPITQPPSGPSSSQQFYGNSRMHETPASQTNPGFSAGYVPSPGSNFNDSYAYSGSPSHYSNSSAMKPPPQHSSFPSAPSGGGGSGYPRLPTAQLLPQALPTVSGGSGSSNSGGSGNRVPIDDVVDKVVLMGFSRDQVRTTVRKLTENGQSVDLNVVLDKLMNGH
ncbi:hypothetical protein MKW94_013586 [Papaver nudicaule]|uniref:DUF1421 domain-containing protein n=1 Tax=Papaver nudicaule TaxID=74823 RepID=A0AA42AXH2_PAPNU|nr:hypothetical protein [Papaver nudicaule]